MYEKADQGTFTINDDFFQGAWSRRLSTACTIANQLWHHPHSTVAYAPCLAFFRPPMSSEQQRKAFPFSEFEPKWQDVWEAKKAFRTPNPGDADFDASKPKYFVLDMFPYPSGAGLHVGVEAFELRRETTDLHGIHECLGHAWRIGQGRRRRQ